MSTLTGRLETAASDTNAVPLALAPTCVKATAPRVPRPSVFSVQQFAVLLLVGLALWGVIALVGAGCLVLWRLIGWMFWGSAP